MVNGPRLYGALISLFLVVAPGCSVSALGTSTRGWEIPTVIGPGADPSSNEFEPPQVAFDASGNATVVWIAGTWPDRVVLASRFVPDAGWGTAAVIGPENAGTSFSPTVGADGSGNVFAFWIQRAEPEPYAYRYSILSNRYAAGAGWGTPISIGTNESAWWAESPQVVVDGRGNAIAIWSQSNLSQVNAAPSVRSLWSNRFVPGAGWGNATLVDPDETQEIDFPRMAADANGGAVAFWTKGEWGINASIWWNRFVPGTGWGTATAFAENASGAVYPHVDAEGNLGAIWTGRDANQSLWSSQFILGTGWSAPALLLTEFDRPYSVTLGPRAGEITMTWLVENGTNAANTTRYDLWVNRFSPYAGWGNATVLGKMMNLPLDAPLPPPVAVDSNGNAVVVWVESVETTPMGEIRASRFIEGSGWGPTTVVDVGNPNSSWLPQVAVDAKGNPMVVWYHVDIHGNAQVLASRLSEGAAAGPSTVPPLSAPEEETQAVVAGLFVAVPLLVGAAVATSSRGLEAISVTTLLPLFTRLRRDDVRNQVNRGRIIQFIADNPGANFGQIRRRVELSNGACAYHLQVLERAGEIQRVAAGVSVRFYRPGHKRDAEALPPLSYVQREVLQALLELQRATFGQILQELEARGVVVTVKNLAYHLRTLARKKELIQTAREGAKTTYFVDDEQREYLQSRLTQETGVDNALEVVAAAQVHKPAGTSTARGAALGRDLLVVVPGDEGADVEKADSSLRRGHR